MTAALLAAATFLTVLSIRHPRAAVGLYVGEPTPRGTSPTRRRPPGPMLAGAAVGTVAASAVDPGSLLPLVLVGSLGGILVDRSVRSTTDERRARHLLQELPTVADTIALHVLAGESVVTSIRRFVDGSSGVASTELGIALASGRSIDMALRAASEDSAHPEASRLYDLLSHAHRTGGSLAEALSALAADYRAAMIRELTAEGGRRALTSYGPILALMIPVTLLFLMYPTLAGLNALATTP